MIYHAPERQPDDPVAIDLMHTDRPQVIASHLLLGDSPAIVDPGPASTIPALEAGLAEVGLNLGAVQVILLTHIHLDHAGATGTLVARFPHMRVYVHRRGSRHLFDPSKLIHSATRLYGDAMERLWGEIRPVPADHVTLLDGGETFAVGRRTIRAYDTPGHAHHHLLYFDETSRGAFVGDTVGVRMPGSRYIRPATPPPDIDMVAWDQSLDLIKQLDPRILLLTHFGPVYATADHLARYQPILHRWSEQVRRGLASGADEPTQIAELQTLADADYREFVEQWQYEQTSPVNANWHGLARYWRKQLAH